MITNLTASKILFWNDGRDTINAGDIASTVPLAILIRAGLKILDVEVLTRSRPANNFAVSKVGDGSRATIIFDYLDKGDGAVI